MVDANAGVHAAGGCVSDWRLSDHMRPSILLCVLLTGVGWVVFQSLVWRGQIPTELPPASDWSGDVFAFGLMSAVLAQGLLIIHELIHGVAMRVCGASPSFGPLRRGRVPYGLYTTAPELFRRNAYIAVALAPGVTLSAVGLAFCLFSPVFRSVSAIAFGMQLGSCIGDLGCVRFVARRPASVLCEDLRDGVRVYEGAPRQSSTGRPMAATEVRAEALGQPLPR